MEGEITSIVQKGQELAYKYFKLAKDELADKIDRMLEKEDVVQDRYFKGPLYWVKPEQIENDTATEVATDIAFKEPVSWGTLDQIGCDMATEVARDAGFDKQHQEYLSIAIIEILANAMESIEKGGFENEITIQYDFVKGKYVRFNIESPGAADLTRIEPHLPEHTLECFRGRGTTICHEFLDAIDYYSGTRIDKNIKKEFTAVSGAMFVKVAAEYAKAS